MCSIEMGEGSWLIEVEGDKDEKCSLCFEDNPTRNMMVINFVGEVFEGSYCRQCLEITFPSIFEINEIEENN